MEGTEKIFQSLPEDPFSTSPFTKLSLRVHIFSKIRDSAEIPHLPALCNLVGMGVAIYEKS